MSQLMDEEHYNTLSLRQLYFLKNMMGKKPVPLCPVGAHLFQVHLLVN